MSSLKDTDRMLDSDRHLGYLGRDSCHLGSGSENFCEAAVTHSDRCANLIVAADLMRTASLQEQRCAASNAQRGEEKSIRLLIATPHSEPSELHVPWRLSARTPIYQYWCLVSAIYEPSVPCVLHFLRSSSCKWEENQFPAPTGCKTKPREACLWNVERLPSQIPDELSRMWRWTQRSTGGRRPKKKLQTESTQGCAVERVIRFLCGAFTYCLRKSDTWPLCVLCFLLFFLWYSLQVFPEDLAPFGPRSEACVNVRPSPTANHRSCSNPIRKVCVRRWFVKLCGPFVDEQLRRRTLMLLNWREGKVFTLLLREAAPAFCSHLFPNVLFLSSCCLFKQRMFQNSVGFVQTRASDQKPLQRSLKVHILRYKAFSLGYKDDFSFNKSSKNWCKESF